MTWEHSCRSRYCYYVEEHKWNEMVTFYFFTKNWSSLPLTINTKSMIITSTSLPWSDKADQNKSKVTLLLIDRINYFNTHNLATGKSSIVPSSVHSWI